MAVLGTWKWGKLGSCIIAHHGYNISLWNAYISSPSRPVYLTHRGGGENPKPRRTDQGLEFGL